MFFIAALSAIERLRWPQAILAGAVLISLWYIVSSIFAWYKLRHIPGPFFASFSYVWAFWVAYSGNSHIILDAEKNKHGDLFRVGPDAVVISDSEAWNQITSARSPYIRGLWYGGTRFDYRGPSLITELDMPKHGKRKSKLASAFSGKHLAILEAKTDEWIATLITTIRTKIANGNETVDIGRVIQYFQVDLITDLGVGQAWKDLEEDKDQFGYLKMSDSVLPAIQSFSFLPWARALYSSIWFMKLFGPKTTDANGLGLFLGTLEKEVGSRFSRNTPKSDASFDILDEWIRHGVPANECQFDLALLVPAGSETSAMMIKGTLLHLMSSPMIYLKAKQEIKNEIAAGRISSPVTNEEAKSLEYMQAVVREGLRLMVPVNFGFPKRVPDSGDTLCGTFLPAGTDVYVNYHSMMRNKEVFGEDADSFRPERFLGSGPNTAHMIKVVELAFGNGRFMCLGKVLAWMEMNKLFIELLRNFDFQITNPEKPWSRASYTTWLVYDFWVRVTEDTTMGDAKHL
ncbi:pisatin demethylase [Xylaria flabelliformis]|nr:pisatin demethylase [Xylaria flabelliformis]